MRNLTIVGISLLTAVAPAQAESRADDPSVHDAVARAAALLVGLQENYVPDPRARRMRDSQLAAWKTRERARLTELRAEQGARRAEWPYEGVHRQRGVVPPGYRVGGTAIACMALMQVPGFAKDATRKRAVRRALRFVLDELQSNELLEPGPKRGYDVRGWAHAYALDFLLIAEERRIVPHYEYDRVREMIPHLIDCLVVNETRHGGWNYASNSISPFMTGSTLLALYRARARGYEVEQGLVERALKGLERSRTSFGSYVYSGVIRQGSESRRGRTAMPGASARASAAELALFLGGRSDAQRLRVAVDAFFAHWDELLKRKSKQGTHEGPYGIAPYYFMYGHTYAALAIESLPAEERATRRAKMRELLWRTRESDGGWNDRIFPRSKSYSTAMAILALLAPEMSALPKWKAERVK